MKLADLGVTLSSEEKVVAEYSFCYSILLFFVKYHIYITNKRFIANVPNAVLGILPLGKNVSTFPLKSIASVKTQTKFRIILMFFAGIFIFIGIGKINLPCLIVGIIIGTLSVPTLIQIESASSSKFAASFAFWDKQKALQLINKTNELIAEL